MKAAATEQVEAPVALEHLSQETLEISINERRQYVARIPIEMPLRIASFRFSAAASSIDVSVSGLQVRTRLPLALGERVILTFTDQGTEASLNICGEVVRIIEEGDEPLSALLPGQGKIGEVFRELARLTAHADVSAAPAYGLRVLKDENVAWQNFIRLQVLS
jgi:PilZ domain